MSEVIGVINRRITMIAILLSVTILSAGGAMAQGPGLAAGFGVDGNLLSNSPSTPPFGSDVDWVPGDAPLSSAVLDNAGIPLDPKNTFHVVDLTKRDDQSVFAGSNKVFHDPNTYQWKSGSVPQKDDINHALFHKRTASNGDVWIIMAGDRRSIKGNSYIDFELLQSAFTKNDNGTFSSAGPHGGRTVGDLLLTILLTRGGSEASILAQRWESDTKAATGYNYHDLALSPGMAYAAANIDSTVWVPYGAFGSTMYQVNAFGEAALNVTELVAKVDPCLTVPTLFVRTKSSASPKAVLKDFVDPIRVGLSPGVNADAGPDKILDCRTHAVELDGASGTPGATFSWTATAGGHIVSGETTLHPTVDAPGVYTLTVTNIDGCTTTDAAIVTQVVLNPPEIVCPDNLTFECGVDGSYGLPDVICDGPCDLALVQDSVPGNCDHSFTLSRTWIATDTCGQKDTCVQTIHVTDVIAPECHVPNDTAITICEAGETICLPVLGHRRL